MAPQFIPAGRVETDQASCNGHRVGTSYGGDDASHDGPVHRDSEQLLAVQRYAIEIAITRAEKNSVRQHGRSAEKRVAGRERPEVFPACDIDTGERSSRSFGRRGRFSEPAVP